MQNPIPGTQTLTRQVADLSGVWRFQVDVAGEGELLRYHLPECDTRMWGEVSVPCTWENCLPLLHGYEGAGWFRREFDLRADEIDAWPVIRFEGVNYTADVWINGRRAGGHDGGFLPFEIPLRSLAKPGRNLLVVRADNTRRLGMVPGKERGWRPYGGILREIVLKVLPIVHLDNMVIHSRADGTFKASAIIRNTSSQQCEGDIALRFEDASARVVYTGDTQHACFSANGQAVVEWAGTVSGVTPWSPDTPTLYTAVMRLTAGGLEDEVRMTTGFRTIQTQDTKVLLNGQPVYLRGFNRHEDTPRRGMRPDPATTESDLRHMKAMGANFVRLAHYPHHPSTLDLCDRLGLLVMDEIPLYWWGRDPNSGEDHSVKLTEATRQLREMIARDINHPSVLFWSVSNETFEHLDPRIVDGNNALVAEAKAIDPSRLAVHVSCHWHGTPHFDNDDVICVNSYPSYSLRCTPPNPECDFTQSTRWWDEQLQRLHERYPGKPILIAEFGYTAIVGSFGNAMGEDAQVAAIRAEAKAFNKSYVCGMTIWCYADHPWPEETFLNYITTSPYGVVTRERRPKHVCASLPLIFNAKPTPPPTVPDFDQASVRMIRPHMRDLPEYSFPDGFGIRTMNRGEAGLWEDVQRDAEPFFKITHGLFDSAFGDDPDAIERRCLLITGRDGCAVGTISAWYSRDFKGGDWGRIHWVAIRRQFQGRGLAKAALSHAMNLLAQWHDRAWLDTSTGRVGAIKLYLDFGFVPDLDAPWAREAWTAYRRKLDHLALAILDQ